MCPSDWLLLLLIVLSVHSQLAYAMNCRCLPPSAPCSRCIKLHIYCSMQKKAYQRALLLGLLFLSLTLSKAKLMKETPLGNGNSSSRSSWDSAAPGALLFLLLFVIYICKPCCNVCAFAVCWASQHWQLHTAHTLHTYTHTCRGNQIEPKQQRTNDEKLKIMFMLLFAFAIFAISLLYALYCVPFPTPLPFPFLTLPYTYVCTYILLHLFFSLCFLFSFSCFTGTCTVGSLGLLRWVQSHRVGSAVGGRATDSDHTACHWSQGCEILFRGYNA